MAKKGTKGMSVGIDDPKVVKREPDAERTVRREADSRADKSSGAGAQTNSQVKSGGSEGDDQVDEQSMESFPASDAPAHY